MSEKSNGDGCYPLHKREFHPEDTIFHSPVVLPGIEDINVFFCKIKDGALGLCLPPHMEANEVLIDDPEMHYQAGKYDHEDHPPYS